MAINIPEVERYIAYMSEHPEWINKERRLLVENVIRPVLAMPGMSFDREQFDNCVRFCEANFYPLMMYQKMIYAMVFLYLDGVRYFAEFDIIMGRGNGKDGMIMPLAVFLTTPMSGMKDYYVEIVANAEKQAKDTFSVAYNNLTLNDKIKPKFKGKFSVTKELVKNLQTGSWIRYNTAGAGTKDGKKPGAIIFNEIHAYKDYSQISVFTSGLGKPSKSLDEKPRSRVFYITTNGYVREGPFDNKLTTCLEILETGENLERIFPFVCRLESNDDIESETAWHKANPSLEYMPALFEEIQREAIQMKRDPRLKAEFKTKRCNLDDVNDEEPVTSWRNILRCCYQGETMDELRRRIPRAVPDTTGFPAVIGIDYADIRDFASAGRLTCTDDGEFVWEQHTWICRASPFFDKIKFPFTNAGEPGYQDFEVVDTPAIPVRPIVGWCISQMKDYDVMAMAMDTYRYQLFEQIFAEEGIIPQSKENPQGLLRLIRKIQSATSVVAPAIEAEFEHGNIIYGDSAIMRWYTRNTGTEMDKYGNQQFIKIEPKLRKNDGFMAFDAAFYFRQLIKQEVVYV